MNSDIYSQPNSDLENGKIIKGKSVKAIVIASIIDIFGTTIYGAIIGVVATIYLTYQGQSFEEIQKYYEQASIFSLLKLSGVLGGLIISIVGGYVCARISINKIKRDAIILSIIIACFSFIVGVGGISVLENTILAIITVGAIILGAYLGARKHNKSLQPTGPAPL